MRPFAIAFRTCYGRVGGGVFVAYGNICLAQKTAQSVRAAPCVLFFVFDKSGCMQTPPGLYLVPEALLYYGSAQMSDAAFRLEEDSSTMP